mmetsp:Transcript_19409/g.46771  ORF Transcript_19409/g.46771 Transcript_19409/m.46771 type:complete len:354 (-) Transcript_19409:336-1397(-)
MDTVGRPFSSFLRSSSGQDSTTGCNTASVAAASRKWAKAEAAGAACVTATVSASNALTKGICFSARSFFCFWLSSSDSMYALLSSNSSRANKNFCRSWVKASWWLSSKAATSLFLRSSTAVQISVNISFLSWSTHCCFASASFFSSSSAISTSRRALKLWTPLATSSFMNLYATASSWVRFFRWARSCSAFMPSVMRCSVSINKSNGTSWAPETSSKEAGNSSNNCTAWSRWTASATSSSAIPSSLASSTAAFSSATRRWAAIWVHFVMAADRAACRASSSRRACSSASASARWRAASSSASCRAFASAAFSSALRWAASAFALAAAGSLSVLVLTGLATAGAGAGATSIWVV